MDLNYRLIGKADSETFIVFLHEGLGCIEMWRDYPAQLCEALNCGGLIYDRAGYGKSPGSLTNRQANYLHLAADELNELVKAVLSDKNIILYGHSDGGSIALIEASRNPHKYRAVITEAAHVFVEEVTIQGVKDAIEPFLAGKLDGLKKFHGDRFQEVFYAWNNIWLTPEFRNWDIRNELPKIDIPALVIQGMEDQYGTLQQVEDICRLTSGRSQKFTPQNCGHAPFKDQPTQVLNTVLNFISGVSYS